MTAGAPLLSVKHLSLGLKTRDGVSEIISDLSFSINRGETVALLGESGCGKTLTSLALARLLPYNCCYLSGSEIHLLDDNLLSISEKAMQKKRGLKISMIFQEPMSSLNPVLTIGQQLDEVLKLHTKKNKAERRDRLLSLIESVGLPDPAQQCAAYPHQLSGGMKQRVMVAIAIAAEPDLIIADEPTTALDVTIQAQMLALLKTIQQRSNIGILLISHDLGVIAQMVDKVLVMYAGEIVEQASVNDFFKAPKHPYSQKLLSVVPSIEKREVMLAAIQGVVPSLLNIQEGCRFYTRCTHAQDKCHQVQNLRQSDYHLVRCCRHEEITDDEIEALPKERMQKNEIIALHTDNLKVHFPIKKGVFGRTVATIKAVDGVSLKLHQGETLALVGESGCGKSTLGQSILQLITPTSGHVECLGQNLAMMRQKSIAPQVQMIFQDPLTSLNPRMLIFDVIAEGLRAQNLARKIIKDTVHELIEAVGLTPDALARYPHEFSGGQRQRIGIARALALKPDVIVCDEPTSALDLSIQAQILNLLQSLQVQYQLSLLFITHDLSVVTYLADNIAVMYLGRIVESGSAVQIMSQPHHPYTKSLLTAIPSLDPNIHMSHLVGEQPSPMAPPSGCYFHPRCPNITQKCVDLYPTSKSVGVHHDSACYLP